MAAVAEMPVLNLDNPTVRALGMVTGIGLSIGLCLLLSVGLGLYLDHRLGTAPVFLVVGILLGLVSAGYSMYRLTHFWGSRG